MARRFIDIGTVKELERLTGRAVPAAERQALQLVMDRFPVRLTPHLLELCRSSPAVAAQHLPDPREGLADQGQEYCFKGLLPTGTAGVERIYPDRCVIMPQPACPAYCRFCFRKFYDHRRGHSLDTGELDAVVAYVARTSDLREVLITGGEPIMNLSALARLLQGLRRIDHVATIRVACRSLVTDPGCIDGELVALLRKHQDLRRGRPVEVAAHVNHPDELTRPTVEALCALGEAGIHVYNQTVLLAGINCDASLMLKLLGELRRHGVETYTIFFGDPVLGVGYLRPTLDEAMALKAELRARATGRANPHLMVTTRLGKVEPGVDGAVVEREPGGQWLWMSTPYTLSGFRRISPDFQLPLDARLNAAGRIEVRFLDGAAGSSCSRRTA